MGGQEHFYLEGQAALATPGEGGDIHVVSSTQHPSEVQHLIAALLGLSSADVTVEVRRMGGAFGGKETQAAAYAAACALVAAKTGRPAKIRADRDDDMVMTGKRHDFTADYDVGFDGEGRIEGISIVLASRCGATADLSLAINDRAMFHADNCYYLPAVEIVSHRLRTHTVSNTAFRGFGGPQGMMAIERVIDAIAAHLGLDPLAVRQANLYGPGRDVTPYHQKVEDNVAPEIIAELAESAGYAARREAVAAFNARHRILKKGLALTPVKFGISFTTTHLNQAGALVLVYADGSIHLNHGGTEMGQGLMIKVAQVVADVFAVPIETREDQRDAHRQGAQHLGHRRLLGLGPQRHGREERRRNDPGSASTPSPRPSRARQAGPSPSSAAAPISRASRSPRPASTPPRRSTTTAPATAAGPSSISLMAPRSARS